MSTSTSTATIPSREFYSEYHGHPVRYLERALPALRASSDRIIWTAGDSSLDNKYWFPDTAPAVGAYERLLNPPLMKQDVTYWLNYHCQQSDARNRTAAVNTAVEATTLNERTFALRRQDIFLRDNIKPQDILIVSVGGNDLALAPCPCTIVSAATFMFCMPEACWRNGFTCGTVPFDDCCCGCGASLASCACGCPPCMGYFRHLYGTRLELYIKALTKKTKPSQILVCMIYYPDETPQPSWAGPALQALGYNANPGKGQALLRKVFYEATSKVHIPGTVVQAVPLFQVLDGKHTEDYTARVEPSPLGGRKMAEFLLDLIDKPPTLTTATTVVGGDVIGVNTGMLPSSSPQTSYIMGRD